jgi:hypothetical protein
VVLHLRLHLLLCVGHLLLRGHLLLAAVVVYLLLVHQRGGLLLLMLIGFEGRGAEGLVGVLVWAVGVLVRGACLHGRDGGLALVYTVVEVSGLALVYGV